jgi:hypothetical protein
MQLRTSNGSIIEVSQAAYDSVYSKYPDKYTPVQTQSSPVNPAPASAPASSSSQKQILSDNGKLYAWDGAKATYISDQATLVKYVQQMGYKDTRAPYSNFVSTSQAPAPAPASSPSPAVSGTKQILADGVKLYADDGKGNITPIPDQKTLENLVLSQGYKDTRAAIPAESTVASPSTSASATSTTPTAGIDNADKTWINQLYQKYFDRDATSAELLNWSKEVPATLDGFLKAESQKYNYTSKYFKDESNKRLDEALATIDASNLPPDIKEMWRTVVKGYPPGVEYDTAEILATFNKVKQETIDPYFKQLADTAVADIRSNMTQLEQTRAQELETERANAGLNIRQAKEGLEKSGMTFTGKAIETLGKDSAYAQPGVGDATTVPAQTPFGGMFYEGTVNQGNRLMATSSELRAKAAREAVARNAENLLGTAGAQGLGLTGLAGTVATGSQEVQKQGQYGSTLNEIISNYRAKQDALTNKTY